MRNSAPIVARLLFRCTSTQEVRHQAEDTTPTMGHHPHAEVNKLTELVGPEGFAVGGVCCRAAAAIQQVCVPPPLHCCHFVIFKRGELLSWLR